MIDNKKNLGDSLLDGFSYDDLVTLVQCNEPEIDEESITRSFEDLVNIQITEARKELLANLDILVMTAIEC